MLKALIVPLLFISVFAFADRSRFTSNPLEHDFLFQGVYQSKYNNRIPFGLALYIDPTFSESARKVIREGVGMFIEHSLNPEILKCAYQNSTKDLPASQSDLKNLHFINAFIPQQIGNSKSFTITPLFISRIWGEYPIYGLARTGSYDFKKYIREGKSFSMKKRFFHVALNSDYIGKESVQRARFDIGICAGSIGHEILHHFSYVHPTGQEGSFIGEYGKCFRDKNYLDRYGFDNWSRVRNRYD